MVSHLSQTRSPVALLNSITAQAYRQSYHQESRFRLNHNHLLALGALSFSAYMMKKKQAECCGIVAYVGKQQRAADIVRDGLLIVQARGYDSAGIASRDSEGRFYESKRASTQESGGDCIASLCTEISEKHKHGIAIAHTRWATHGKKTVENAHPHTVNSTYGDYSVV